MDTPATSGEGDGLTAADRLKYTEAFNIFDKHQQLGLLRCLGVGGFFWGRQISGKKWDVLRCSKKTQMWTKMTLGDVWYVFVEQIF